MFWLANTGPIFIKDKQNVIFLRRPSRNGIAEFIESQYSRELTYPEVGATKTTPPNGYVVDHTRGLLGQGEVTFHHAVELLSRWQHFQLDWVEICWPDTRAEEGSVVGILARLCGIWFLNACRVVYTIDDKGSIHRFGFAYGTLPEHAECGEERFMIEWDSSNDQVHYDLFAFSKPNKWYTKFGYPITRRMQRTFAKDSIIAMQTAVSERLAKTHPSVPDSIA